MMFGDFPPSSSIVRLLCKAAIDPNLSPTWVLPVNVIPVTRGSRQMASPTPPPGPVSTVNARAGNPASTHNRARYRALSGVDCDGLTITVFPAASAGAAFDTHSTSGTFQGTIAATTPRGSRTV